MTGRIEKVTTKPKWVIRAECSWAQRSHPTDPAKVRPALVAPRVPLRACIALYALIGSDATPFTTAERHPVRLSRIHRAPHPATGC
jgi:hypothetical protein